MKSSVDGTPTEELDCNCYNRKGGDLRRLGGVCGVEIVFLNGTDEMYSYLLGSCVVQAWADRLVISSKKWE